MRIGFVGLGNMGSAMAMNLLKAGHDVTAYNRSAEKAKPLLERGAHVGTSPAEASRGDVVFTMLADDHAVESAVYGESGILANLRPGCVHISSSTISVALAQKLAAEHEKHQQQFISAPVFGRPEAAEAGKLFVVVAGPNDVVERCLPLFEAIGQRTFRFGEQPSTANLIKLSGNFLIASVLESLSEAMALVGKAGIDQHQYLDFLTSTLFAAPVYKTYGGLIADRKFQPAGFAAPLGLKDVRLTLAAGEQFRVPLPLASLIRDRFLALLARGGDALDWSAISQIAAEDSGQGSTTGRAA
ncbi:MAG TPA: NAD(P)-dependent oxidoreductase [Verrucomicrobiae bacterium]|nr:NAD(P)-dependent oxidoreductase [Verrucomicrobiae bacterium]